ncbi:hypothetical protein ACHHYP_01534 [Achlya hypogyna]|uniref:Uncharacterized protein n=1 Tax=Achlya hypogyna TaxID=1202772 RepID=A0A1V9Z8K7_ACHHY|nr:hypothetical protein ACHHYP_01534 [Achlya hypogyna]
MASDGSAKLTMQLVRKSMQVQPASSIDGGDGGDEVEQLLSRRTLRLDWLNIGKIENLDVFTHIRELYLQHNAISAIENLDFHTNLEFLALAHNCITKVRGGLFHSSPASDLKFLDLANNQIAELSLDELPPSLRVLRLAGNPWAEARADYAALCFDHLPHLEVHSSAQRPMSAQCRSATTTRETCQLRTARRKDTAPATLSSCRAPVGSRRGAAHRLTVEFDVATPRDEIKKQKERLSEEHTAKVHGLHQALEQVRWSSRRRLTASCQTRSAIVERSMARLREKRQKLHEETQKHLRDAASHFEKLRVEHASWRKEQLQAHQA